MTTLWKSFAHLQRIKSECLQVSQRFLPKCFLSPLLGRLRLSARQTTCPCIWSHFIWNVRLGSDFKGSHQSFPFGTTVTPCFRKTVCVAGGGRVGGCRHAHVHAGAYVPR